jgi:hypothetical protein
MWYAVVLLAVLVAVSYRRSLPAGATVTWRDVVWVSAMAFAVTGLGLAGFALGPARLPWPDNVLAAATVAGVAVTPLATCFLLRLPRQVR